MTRIVELHSENFKRLRAVTIRPEGDVVILNGRNGQGKSSAIDAIWAALGGAKACPEQPIHEGAKKARTVVKLDSGLVVERTWNAATGTRLTVTTGEGQKLKGPQSILDALTASLTFDPLKFAEMERGEQARLLRELTGCDTSDLDSRREQLFDQRTTVNRTLRDLEGQLRDMPHHADAPAEPVSVASLTAELQRRNQQSQEVAELGAAASDAAATVRAFEAEQTRLADVIAELERRIAATRGELQAIGPELEQAKAESVQATELFRAAREGLESTDDVMTQLANAEETNERVRANAARARVATALEDTRAKAEALTTELRAIDEQKAERLAATKFPIDGLGFDEGAVTFNGFPLTQASHAERVRISAAIGLALHPELRVLLIRDAEKLDQDGMRLIAELAAEHDAQLWLERAGHTDPGAVVIEDGEVAP